ncbi:ABC transporter substrate-binding protein [Streptosporangium sp. NPDC023615]|uniref:ABC transporter substrate-binding protein n=1 Tax=Streptosporangium sp. NPDC023615 TaxID=3154794 RepID=UPI0034183ED8
MRFTRARRAVVAGVAAALALSACGGPGERGGTAVASAGSAGGPERTAITIGALPIPDAASLYIAEQRGYFEEEGLDVTVKTVVGGAQAQQALLAGTLDATQTNYVSTFLAVSAGEKLKIVADLYQATPNSFNIMVARDSPIRDLAGLKGRKIAVNSRRNVGTLAVTSLLTAHGLKEDDVTFVQCPFPDMQDKLARGAVDAAWMAEPHLTMAQKGIGAQKLADTMVGSTADLPIAGVAVTGRFAEENPRTVAAFQRAMHRAQRVAASDRGAVEEILPTYIGIDAATAAVVTLGAFPTRLGETRLQRVADLMVEHGYLKRPIAAETVLLGNAG